MADGAPGDDARDVAGERTLAVELVDVFIRFAKGDLTARVPRNFKGDNEDAIAFFVGVIAEQLADRQRGHDELSAGVSTLVEKFIAVAAGDFSVRAHRTHRGDALDTLAFLLNNVASEIGDLVGDHDRQRVQLETVLESMLDGVLLLDPQGRIRRCNAAMANLLGRQPRDIVDLHVSDVLAPAERELATRLSEQLTEGSFRNRDTLFRSVDGAPLTMAVNGSAHRDVDGTLVGVVLVARDERELRTVRAHLQLSDRLAAMGTLAAGVAHEINNPLAFLSANLDFLLEELHDLEQGRALSDERMTEILRALRSSRGGAERVRHIVRDLGFFARSDPEAVARVDLNGLLESALGFVGNSLRRHARLVKRYGCPPPVLANEGRLVQVFLNLIQNAVQAIAPGAPEQNEIRVVTGDTANGAFVEIHDTGCGIPEESLPRVFDLFYTTKPVGLGMGLGLSISLRLVENAGGRLDVQSTVGKGSVFRVVLPAVLEDGAG
jgi:two-component system NtrC family sensor kinase